MSYDDAFVQSLSNQCECISKPKRMSHWAGADTTNSFVNSACLCSLSCCSLSCSNYSNLNIVSLRVGNYRVQTKIVSVHERYLKAITCFHWILLCDIQQQTRETLKRVLGAIARGAQHYWKILSGSRSLLCFAVDRPIQHWKVALVSIPTIAREDEGTIKKHKISVMGCRKTKE